MSTHRRPPLLRRAVPELVTVLAIAVVALGLLTQALDPDDGTVEAATPPAPESADQGTPPPPGVDAGIHALPTRWTDHEGRTGTLAELAPGIRVTAMIYTDCSMACPIIVGDMKRVEAALVARGVAEGVGFTLVSLDPERDTPERLARFAADARLTPGRWTLLHGEESQVRTLSVLLGVAWDRGTDGSIGHSNRIAVLDAQGRIVAVADGLGVDVGPLVEAAARLAGEEARR